MEIKLTIDEIELEYIRLALYRMQKVAKKKKHIEVEIDVGVLLEKISNQYTHA